MIAEIGHALLWLAAGCALLQAVGGLLPQARIAGLTVTAAALQAWLWLGIAACLGWIFWTTDLSVAGVAATTDAGTPDGLKLLAIVVQDGGWLIAATALIAAAGVGLAFARPSQRGLGALGAAGVVLTATLILAVAPFARLAPAPTEGAGFPVTIRAGLAGIGGVPGAPLALGATRGDTTLVAVTPLAGPDWTGVAAEVRAGGTVLLPEWRETTRQHAGYPVAAHGLGPGGWTTATLAPDTGRRWRVGVSRIGWAWLLLPLLAVAGGVWAWRRR